MRHQDQDEQLQERVNWQISRWIADATADIREDLGEMRGTMRADVGELRYRMRGLERRMDKQCEPKHRSTLLRIMALPWRVILTAAGLAIGWAMVITGHMTAEELRAWIARSGGH